MSQPSRRPPARQRADGFDFTAAMRKVCSDLAAALPELSHVDIRQVAMRFCQCRQSGPHGVHATLTPLRFEQGALETTRGRRRWTIDRLFDSEGQEMLYLLSFYLPRFMLPSLEEKLATVIHELWHISPRFDGDLRRHPGRCYAHGRSEREYHAQMRELARRYLMSIQVGASLAFLQGSVADLVRQHGRVYGVRIRTPRLIPASAQPNHAARR